METLEALAGQLESIEDLQSITRTMKALSAASIRQYERAVEALEDYYRAVELGLHVVLRDLPAGERPPTEAGGPPGVVIFGSDQGLCGRFNDHAIEHALERVEAAGFAPADCRLLAVGGRIDAGLDRRGRTVDQSFFVPGSTDGITATVGQLLVAVDGWREAGVERVELVYNQPVSGGGYRTADSRLLPLDVHRLRAAEAVAWPSRRLPDYRLPAPRLLARLTREYLFVLLFRACAQSLASEHASRLRAMTAADRNIREHLESARMAYQRRRQEAITAELIDVVSGFDALADGAGE